MKSKDIYVLFEWLFVVQLFPTSHQQMLVRIVLLARLQLGDLHVQFLQLWQYHWEPTCITKSTEPMSIPISMMMRSHKPQHHVLGVFQLRA